MKTIKKEEQIPLFPNWVESEQYLGENRRTQDRKQFSPHKSMASTIELWTNSLLIDVINWNDIFS